MAQLLCSDLELGAIIWVQDFSLRLRRDSLQSAGFFSRGPGFNFQHPHSSSQLTVTLAPWDSTPSSGVSEYEICMWYTDMLFIDKKNVKIIK